MIKKDTNFLEQKKQSSKKPKGFYKKNPFPIFDESNIEKVENEFSFDLNDTNKFGYYNAHQYIALESALKNWKGTKDGKQIKLSSQSVLILNKLFEISDICFKMDSKFNGYLKMSLSDISVVTGISSKFSVEKAIDFLWENEFLDVYSTGIKTKRIYKVNKKNIYQVLEKFVSESKQYKKFQKIIVCHTEKNSP